MSRGADGFQEEVRWEEWGVEGSARDGQPYLDSTKSPSLARALARILRKDGVVPDCRAVRRTVVAGPWRALPDIAPEEST